MKDDRIIAEIENRTPETSVKREAKLKQERIPVYKQEALTFTGQEPGWHYRMVNDTPGRIQKFLRGGWEIVTGNVEDTYSGKGRKEASNSGSCIKRIVDPNYLYQDGVLMRIPINLWKMDQQEKEEKLDMMEEDLDPKGCLRNARQLAPRANLNIKK